MKILQNSKIISGQGKKEPIYRQIVHYLTEQIELGVVKPGQNLPPMRDMVRQWGVGYPTVKMALEVLEKEGLISMNRERGVGAVVNPYVDKNVQSQILLLLLRWSCDSLHLAIEKGIHDFITKVGCNFSIIDVHENTKQFLEIVLNPPEEANGLIVYPFDTPKHRRAIETALQKDTKMIFVDRFLPGFSVSSVAPDNFAGAYYATKHLIDLHKCPVHHFGISDTPTSYFQRYKGWRIAMREYNYNATKHFHQLPISESNNCINLPDEEWVKLVRDVAYKEGLKLFKTQKEDKYCIFCIHDDTAMGIYAAAEEVNYKIGEKVFIVGFGNMPFCELLSTPLTSVNEYDEKVGYEAAKLLYQELTKEIKNPINKILPVELKIRASSIGVDKP
jgi:GntR family transcriptional regulator, arabinose operon transcriptional repressor